MVRCVLDILRARLCHNQTNQAFIRCEARALYRFRFQAFSGDEFKVTVFEAEIDGTHIAHEGARDEFHNTGQTSIQATPLGHELTEPRHQNARRNSSCGSMAIRMRHLGDRVSSYVTASSS